MAVFNQNFQQPKQASPTNTPFTNGNKLLIFAFRFFPFLIGLIGAQKIVVGGEIYLGEILAVAYLFFNFRRLEINRSIRPLLLLGIVWAACQFVSDQINQIDGIDSVKGVGTPLVFISTIAALSIFLSRDIQRTPSFLVGVYLGYIPEFIFFPSLYFQGNSWKWGIGTMVLGLFSVYFTYFIKRRKIAYLFAFAGIFFLVGIINDSRSSAIFPLFAAFAYIALRARQFGSIFDKFKGSFGITKLSLIIIFSLFIINTAASAIFLSPWVLSNLPEESAKKFQLQAGGEYGILLGGRNEMLVSINAFLEKPLLGHGSWAKDNGKYANQLLKLSYDLGYSDKNDLTSQANLIPVHSYIMGALVWAGIAGGLFWLMMIRWLLKIFIANKSQLGFYFYNGIIAIMWNIMFSPFGASARWSTAVFIAALYCAAKFNLRNKDLR